MRVLLVDTNHAQRARWAAAFARAGHSIVEAADKDTARRYLLSSVFDAMVLDLWLGDGSGLAVATLSGYTNPDCRVVITTDTKLYPRGELFVLAPAVQAVLRHPVSVPELLAVVEHNSTVLQPPATAISA